ncbi:PAS domain-containing sensor histidine kinase [Parvularcula oceani]|uniref:PAS domain-containing sensor histidine kinase n=1 Tax=Parvularcula oceani TaxID=1247963 RepID=UPI00068CC777|nr:PAS domain S-box protein [Parvularcula oceani]
MLPHDGSHPKASASRASGLPVDAEHLFDAAPALVAVHEGPRHVYLYANALARAAAGGKPLIGHALGEVLPGILDETVLSAFDKAFRTGRRVENLELAVRMDRGKRDREGKRYFRQTIEPWRRPDGSVGGVTSFTFEITDEVIARRAAEDGENRLRRVLDGVHAFVARLSPEGVLLEVNTPALEIGGVTRDEVIGLDFWDTYWWAHDGEVQDELRRAVDIVRRGATMRYDVEVRTAGDERITVDFQLAPKIDSEGVLIGLIASGFDITDRNRTEAALRKERATLDAILDALPVGVIVADARGRIVRDNPANREIWGVPPQTEDWEGYEAWVGWRPETGERLAPEDWAMTRALLHGEEIRDELVECQRFDDGGRRVFLNNAAPVRGPDGEIVGGVVAELDVTERRAVEQKLAQSEARFRTLADNMSQLAWITDGTGAIVWYNKRWFDYTGTTMDEMAGWGWVSVHHPDHVDRVTRTISHAFEHGEAWEDLFPLRGTDGEYRWFLSRALPIRDEDGEVVSWFGTNTDVTEQRETEARLRNSEARFRAITEAMPQIAWSARPDGRFDFFNARWFEFTGEAPEDNEEERWSLCLHPEDRAAFLESWQQAVKSGRWFQAEGRLLHHSGEYRWILARALPVEGRDGQISRWMGTFTDIDEMKKGEEQRELLTHELNHRVKNNLAIVQSMARQSFTDPACGAQLETFQGRLTSLAAAHDLLTRGSWETAALESLARDVLSSCGVPGDRVEIGGPSVALPPRAAVAMAMTLHELTTNAIKYGALSNGTGRISLVWALGEEGVMRLRWAETGGPVVTQPKRKGFGSRMIEEALTSAMSGTCRLSFEPSGLVFELDGHVPHEEA